MKRKNSQRPRLKSDCHTCTRVPVQDSHSIEIDVTLNQDTTVKEIQNYLHKINVLFL